MPRRRPARKPRRRPARKHRVPRGIAAPSQMAVCTETIEYQNITANTYTAMAFNLAQFQRATQMATLFRFYKAAKVEWTLEPMFNVFQGGAGNGTIPYLYTIMNRSQERDTLVLGDLLAMGAKPVKLTSKHVQSYRPNWCSPGMAAMLVSPASGIAGGVVQNVVTQGRKVEYDWLATPANWYGTQTTADLTTIIGNIGSVTNAGNNMVPDSAALAVYNGHGYYIEQKNAFAGIMACKLTARVTWVFKDPRYVNAGSNTDIFKIDVSGNYVPTVPDV